MAEASHLPQSHSSELSAQLASPSHHRFRGTHSWFAHSSSSSWQNAGMENRSEKTETLGRISVITVAVQSEEGRKRMGTATSRQV